MKKFVKSEFSIYVHRHYRMFNADRFIRKKNDCHIANLNAVKDQYQKAKTFALRLGGKTFWPVARTIKDLQKLDLSALGTRHLGLEITIQRET